MFNKISIKAFKSYRDETIPLKQLNVLLGLNSSGKSTVVHALRMLARVANGHKGEDALVEGHGSLAELFNRNMTLGDLCLKLEYDTNGKDDQIEFSESNEGSSNPEFPSVVYIGADRFGPQPNIPVQYNHDIGPHGENMLNLLNEIQDNIMPESLRHPDSDKNTVVTNIEKWLQEITPGVKFDLTCPQKTDLSYAHFNGFRSSNVGFGLSYILPVLISLAYAAVKGNTVVIIENPEAHLHPKGQTQIGEYICRAAKAGVQIFIETHSDHLFDGIRIHAKRDPEHKFHKSVNIVWCRQNEEGNTEIEYPELNSQGRISEWPVDMFDQFENNSFELM